MKLVRYGDFGSEKPGVIDTNGRIRDLSTVITDIDSAFLNRGGLDLSLIHISEPTRPY